MADVPGPDDPRYWQRLAKGPPLDEWVALDSPSAKARRDEQRRGEEIAWRVVWGLFAAIVVAGVVWLAVSSKTSDPIDNLEGCAVSAAPCLTPDGLVAFPTPSGIATISLEEFRDIARDP